MLRTPAIQQSARFAVPDPIQQLFITHCLRDEGVYGEAGFTVRAASTLDPLLIRFALEYPLYAAPIGVGNHQSVTETAPSRLALVRIPGGKSALIHSVYLREDERGRANNFFSHILIQPTMGARQALTTWASPQWTTSCSPDLGTDLAPLDELPESGALNDDVVTAFLQQEVRGGDDLAIDTCPTRLANEPRRRRELVRLALRGCLLVLQGSPVAARGRFFLLAEPGLTALLLYAAARLMPDALASNLTFSTYENAQRELRTYRHARVIGTYTADPARGLEPEFFTTRGYALDTFQHQFSPELAAEADPAIEEWIELAARGDWETIDKVQRLLGKTTTSVAPFAEGVQVARISLRLASGKATSDDLLSLKQSPWGSAILADHRSKIWPLVRENSLRDERLREQFADVLVEHLPELERQAGDALVAQPPGDWQPSWRLLCGLLKDDPARLRETLQRILPEPPYPPALRLALLRELHRCQLSPLDQRAPWHALLRLCSPEDLEHIANSDVPRDWFIWCIVYALMKSDARAEAVGYLHTGSEDLLSAFWEQFKLFREEGQRRAILTPLFPPADQTGFRFLERMLTLRPAVRGETLQWLLETFNAFSGEGAEFWGRDNHLGLLMDMLRHLGAEAGPMWDRLCDLIGPDLLPPGDAYQNLVLMELAAAKDRPGPPLPPRTAQTVTDWILLREHFEKATDVPESSRRAVIDACNRLRFDSIVVLGRYFQRFILPQGINQTVLADFAGFFHTFFLAGMDHQDYSSRLIAWLQIVSSCPEESQRAAYQGYYLETHIPLEFRQRLAEETREAGRLLPVAFEARQENRTLTLEPTAPASEDTNATLAREPLFHLVGVQQAAGQPATFPRSVANRCFWLLCPLLAGLLAAWLVNLYKLPMQQTIFLLPFLPLVLLLVESVTIQSVGLTAQSQREAASIRKLGRELLSGAVLGFVLTLLVGSIMAAAGWPIRVILCVGGAVAAGMTGGALIGWGVPSLLRRLHWDGRLAAGFIARALADAGAVLIYFSLARWLPL